MTIHTVLANLEAGDTITAIKCGHGEVLLRIGSDLMVWVHRRETPEVYAEMCERFGLKEESETEAA